MITSLSKKKPILIITLIATIGLAIWQDWSIYQLILLYWFEGVFLIIFSVIVLALFENKFVALLLFLLIGIPFGFAGYFLFKQPDIIQIITSPTIIFPLIGTALIQEFFLFNSEIQKPKNKFNNLPDSQWNMVIGRPLYHAFVISVFLSFGGITLFSNLIAIILFLLVKMYFDNKFFIITNQKNNPS